MHTVALFYVILALSLTYVAFTKVENEILVFSRNSYYKPIKSVGSPDFLWNSPFDWMGLARTGYVLNWSF